MNTMSDDSRHVPQLAIDTEAITAHFTALLNADPCPFCARPVLAVAADAALMLNEILRLHLALLETRRESADRLAAIQAALGAADDGEDDPLMFLRWGA